MVEKLEVSTTLVKKVTGIINREIEAGRDSYQWAENFESRIAQIAQDVLPDLTAEVIRGLQGRFITVFLYCMYLMENNENELNRPTNSKPAETKSSPKTRNNNNRKHQRRLDGLNKLPPFEATRYKKNKKTKGK